MSQGALLSGFWWYRPLKMATTVYERGIGWGEKKRPPLFVPIGGKSYRERFAVQGNTAASKTGNSVISLL